jgi:hypothetical protein
MKKPTMDANTHDKSIVKILFITLVFTTEKTGYRIFVIVLAILAMLAFIYMAKEWTIPAYILERISLAKLLNLFK